MAVYTTFFVMSATALTSAFPDWKPPLPEPESRVVTTLFGTQTVHTRAPLFDPSKTPFPATGTAKVIVGSYSDYLEARLPDAVANAPHWATKGLTSVELDPLGAIVDARPSMQVALFGPPPQSCVIYEFRKEVLSAILASPDEFARRWAAEMSTTVHTHSQTGVRVSPDWAIEDALRIIEHLRALMEESADSASLYLLIES